MITMYSCTAILYLLILQENAAAGTNPINRARTYLEREVSRITDVYALSIVSYALRVVDSLLANQAFTRLQGLATVRGKVTP